MKIEEAVIQGRNSGLKGWELVEFARKLVASHMKYSYSNSFDMPGTAFRKGRGYCWQQAASLNKILKGLGFDSRLVYAVKNLIPEKYFEGVLIEEHYSGHVWCRVKIAGAEKDVCPGSINNSPGKLHFTPVSEIKEWNFITGAGSYFGSIAVNYKRLSRIKKAGPDRKVNLD